MIALDIHKDLTVGELISQLEKANRNSAVGLWDYLNPIYKHATDTNGTLFDAHFRLPVHEEPE